MAGFLMEKAWPIGYVCAKRALLMQSLHERPYYLNEIGTSDKTIIDKYIRPESRPYMKIDIGWPGKPPEFKVKL